MIKWILILFVCPTLHATQPSALGFAALKRAQAVQDKIGDRLSQYFPDTILDVRRDGAEFVLKVTTPNGREHAALRKAYPPTTRLDGVSIVVVFTGVTKPKRVPAAPPRVIEAAAPAVAQSLIEGDSDPRLWRELGIRSRFVAHLKARGYPVTAESFAMIEDELHLSIGIGNEVARATVARFYPEGTTFEGLPLRFEFRAGPKRALPQACTDSLAAE